MSLVVLVSFLLYAVVYATSEQHAFSWLGRSQGSSLQAILHHRDFEKLVNETLREWHVPGLAFAIVDGYEIHAKGFGIATFSDTAVTSQTMFGAGSTTKSQTAAALSLLIDDNENHPALNWDTPISHVIRDDFVLTDKWATEHLTFEDALSHRTGMPRYDGSYGGANSTNQRDVTRSLRHLPMTREPRTTFQYCNVMFAVVGHAIESLTGSRLGDFFRSRIWQPLGMDNTFLYNDEALQFVEFHRSVQLATPYAWVPDEKGAEFDSDAKGHYAADALMNLDAISGAGSVLTTAEDYAKYLRSMLHESGPLSTAAYKELKTARSFALDLDENIDAYVGTALYSLGWVWMDYQGHQFWGHGGSSNYGAEMRYFPDDDWAMVCLANTESTSNLACNILMGHILEEKYTPKDRFDWAAHEREKVKKFKESTDLKAARYRLFPEVVRRHPPGPLVPLTEHEGVFAHPAYRTVNVTTRKETGGRQYLHVRTMDHTFGAQIDLHHVSYEWFLTEATRSWPKEEFERYPERYQYGDEGPVRSIGRATFEISSTGQVISLGIELDSLLVEKAAREGKPREDGMIWFERLK